MKKIFAFAIISFLSVFQITNASHLMGGEITWKSLGNGVFKFRMVVYRDCAGIPLSGVLGLNVLNCPGVTLIPVHQVSDLDISPYSTCDTCASANFLTVGAVEEFIFESDTISLGGAPPLSGWVFSWTYCCRNSAINNLVNGGGLGFTLRAVMYSVNSQPVNVIGNSSPEFMEKPVIATGTGIDFSYTPLAEDVERDSLSYSFGQPYDQWVGPGWPPPNCPFSPGYSIASPLPGIIQNNNNQPLTLNTLTGEMFFRSYTPGNFVTVTKVSEYRCGQLISEIYRELQFIIINSVPLTGTNLLNTAPDVIPPFIDAQGLPTFEDTVFAGDYVSVPIIVQEYDSVELFNQTFDINAYSQQFGTNYVDSTAGCLIAPCATLSPAPPIVSQQNASMITFNWQTTLNHLGLNYPCAYLPNTYTFLIKSKDDYCPVHAFTYKPIRITVMPTIPKPPVVNTGSKLQTPLVNGYNYQWYKNRWPVIGATANDFSPSSNGTYQVRVIDSTGGGNYSAGIYINYTGIDENQSVNSLSINPNPSRGRFNISGIKTNHAFNMVVRNLQGQIVYQKKYNSPAKELPVMMNLSSGIYSLSISADDFSASEKLIIQ